MRTLTSIFLTLTLTIFVLAGCDAFNDDEGGIVTLTGTVVNSLTRVGVEDVIVQVSISDSIAITNAQGQYTLQFEADSTQELVLSYSKSGFISTDTEVTIVPERTIDVAPVLFVEVDTGDGDDDDDDPLIRSSGRASNILLDSQSATSIGVRESGSVEVAELVFQATDSLGREITPENAATISFRFGANPSGEAFIFPETATTDENGRVKTNISSGTIAGVVQVIATATVDGRVIQSKPVAIAIHGGLPDEDHFGIAPQVFNVARAWEVWGIETSITAFVGDQYSNPVRQGTVVYFTSSAGIIGGSATTGALGTGSVSIISAPPQPDHPEFGPGYVTITGSTADRDEVEITDDTVILFSGSTRIVYDSNQPDLDVGPTYTYSVYDQNMNPLAAGTNIQVIAEGTNVVAVGNTNVLLTDNLFGNHNFDNQGITYGITRFTFGIARGPEVNDLNEPIDPEPEAVTIRVTSPNGNLERVIFQNGGVFTRTDSGELIPVLD